MTRPRIEDQEARDKARLSLGKNIVVEAGAGTGKTTLLTDRILFSLLAGPGKGTDISRIVALTFTEKAAGEIKLRLSDKLSDLLALIDGRPLPEKRLNAARLWIGEAEKHFGRSPEDIRKDADAAVNALDRVLIGTIHHFAAHVLRLHPIEAGVDPSFEVDDGTAFEELFAAQWALWLDDELGAAPRRRELWLSVLQLATLGDLEKIARELCREGARQGRVGTTKEMTAAVKKLADEFARIENGKPDPGGSSRIGDVLKAVSSHLKALAGALENGRSLPQTRPLPKIGQSVWPKKWADLPGQELYEEGRSLAEEVSDVSESLIARAVELLLPFADDFREKYSRRGFIGYDGLLTAARALIRDNAAVRRELKGRFDVLLIDEFQDTDPLQGELLLFLAEEKESAAKDWRKIRFAPGKIFIVGDPKQSIYRFRGADIRAYERFTRLLLDQGAEKCDLRTNFRSHAGLALPVNAVFTEAMRGEEGLQPDYLAIYPRPEADDSQSPGVEMVLVYDPENVKAKIKAEARQAAEAGWMVEWILKHCGEDNECRYRDVAILLRTTAPLGAYLEALKGAGIPYVVEADRYFYGTQEVIDFINLLRVLDDPNDRLSLAGLLRSPLCGLDDRDLYELSRAKALSYLKDPPSGCVSPAGKTRCAAFFEILRGLRRHAGKEPLGDFVSRVLGETFLLEHASAAYHHEQTASNLMKFGRMAALAGEGRGATLKEFIGEVCRSMDDSSDEGESPLADEQLDAVRILTIHKSKGLEYPVVLLPNLTAKKGGGQEKPVSALDWGEQTLGLRLPKAKAADTAMALIERAESRREAREAVRLLYVAMTRAKERLVLIGGADPGDKSSFSAILQGAGAWPEKGERPDRLSLPGAEIAISYVDVGRGWGATRRGPIQKKPRIDGGALARLWLKRRAESAARRAATLFTSPTAYLHEPDKAHFKTEDQTAAPSASLLGQVCHSVLEKIDFKSKNIDAHLSAACARLARQYPAADWNNIGKQGREILSGFLVSSAAREISGGEILGREIPFVCARAGQVLRGSMDLLYRDRGKLWVVDYKTSRVAAGGAENQAARYAEQGRAYVDALKRSTGLDCGFKIVFLRSGEIVEVL